MGCFRTAGILYECLRTYGLFQTKLKGFFTPQFQVWDNGESGENKPKSSPCPLPLKNIFRQQYHLGKAKGNNTATTTL